MHKPLEVVPEYLVLAVLVLLVNVAWGLRGSFTVVIFESFVLDEVVWALLEALLVVHL